MANFHLFQRLYFLKENFDEQRVDSLESENANVEFWSNLVLIEGYFDQDDDSDERANSFSLILIDIWKTKLLKDFTDHDFIVIPLENQTGDFGISFYQKKYSDLK